jgi:NAD(P)-dependent dehydrogenase (short-subunit alcohol dehydrogenase family)
MTPFHLQNKTILITGASSGIGRQVAISISQMGGTAVVTGRNEDRLNETISLLTGTQHLCYSADLLDETARTKLIEKLPPLDGIVHCAGIVNPYPIKFINAKKINETFKINYEVPVLLMATISKNKKLNNKASIVFLSSISGQHPHKGGAMYAGSKAAIEAFSKVTALEFYSQGIRSNCISPAMVKTNMYDRAEEGMSKQSMDEHVNQYPLGVGSPEDVANAVIYLLSDASKWVTGINLILDGGFLLEAK